MKKIALYQLILWLFKQDLINYDYDTQFIYFHRSLIMLLFLCHMILHRSEIREC